ncbi:MAG TPA: lipid A-modifier LpxR family protein [Thermohalobaculum sp.]|nr:lipid A-modifier LpxR family protein [Thermohalobaculum sp.]
MPRRSTAATLALSILTSAPVHAGDLSEGWEWLAKTNEIQTEGAIWNDRFGDGKDRWKTGGLTQSYVFPEHIFGRTPWFGDRASAAELNVRGVLMTPDNTANTGVDRNDRPYAQYAGAGVYLRSIARPDMMGPDFGLQEESRIGLEVGWQGDPLPLFDVQDALHGMTGTKGSAANLSNIIDGEVLVNLEGRHTWRYHWGGEDRDVEFAPFVQGSLGMRETSIRAGADVILGSSLEGRTWGNDLATGALLAGASMPRQGYHWSVFAGGDVGYVAADAFLDGGFSVDGPDIARRKLVARLHGGVLLEYDNLGIGFSLNWLGKEFKGQPEGQVVGAVQLKFRL